MGFKLADLFVQVSANGIPDVESKLGKVKSSLMSVASAATGLGGIFTAGALGAGLAACVHAFGEAERAGAKLDAVLKSTGGTVGLTGEQIRELSAGLQRITVYEDDATNAAAAMLLTFTEIRGDVFRQAIASAQDLSTVMGQDLRSSVMQIGKALQDPIAGITALRRAGVSFNESQRELIENLVNSGQQLEAQKMILAELHKEFGGAAAAEAATMTGRIEQMKNAWGDLAETVGGKVAPALQRAAELLRDLATGAPEPGNPQDTSNAINSRRMSAIRAQQKKLDDEELAINTQRFWGIGPKGSHLLEPEEIERLKQIAAERKQLAQEAEKLGPVAFNKAQATQGIFGQPRGEAPTKSDAEIAQDAKALGVLGHPGKQKEEPHRGKNLLSHFEKIAHAQEKIRQEGQRIMRENMTAEERYAEKVEQINELHKKGGLTDEQAQTARHRAAEEAADAMINKHHVSEWRGGMEQLASHFQDAVFESSAKAKQEEDRKKIIEQLQGLNKGININNPERVRFVLGAN